MKFKLFTLIIIGFFTLNSCGTTTQFYYNSSASFPHYSSSTETVMNVVSNDTDNTRRYAVITAIDNRETEYILLAPKDVGRVDSDNEISAFEISYATHIDLEAAQNFSESLEIIISRWDQLSDDDGYFYKFESTPVSDVQQISENEIQYAPSVNFYFNITDEGSIGELIFNYKILSTGEAIVSSFEMDDREDIVDLKSLLDNGLAYFN